MLLPVLYHVAVIFIFAGPIEAATCYNPDRTIASNSVPCSSDNTTFCCTTGAICLSTGYCLSVATQPFVLYRGSCTNSEWGSSCAYYCGSLLSISRETNPLTHISRIVNYQTGSNAPIVSVGLNDNSRAIYCCGYQSEYNNATRCSNGDAPFVLEDGNMIFGRAALFNATASRLNSSSTGVSVASMTGTTNTADGNEECPSSHGNSTAIGVGVGVPLGVLALCAVAWAFTERRRRSRSNQRTDTGAAQETGRVHMPPRRKCGPTELDHPTSTNSDSLVNSPVVEIMGSEARRE
jgi:hypothetical protein